MLESNFPAFDLLEGDENVFDGFGKFLENTQSANEYLEEVYNQAISRIEDIYEMTSHCELDIIDILEKIIEEMWNEGWNPRNGDINLFTRDFGCILAKEIKKRLNGIFVFRSNKDLSNLSLWWKEKKIEIFPFHKVFKRLSKREGESISYFYSSLKKILNAG